MRKVATPSLWGEIQSPGSEWRRSKFARSRAAVGRSVLEQRNATGLNVHPVCWNDVAWSIPPPHLHHHHHHPPLSSPTVKTAAALLREREDKKNLPKPTLFFLCSSRSPARTFSFSTHSLTSCSLSASPPPSPFLWRGVVFRSPPATRGRPRWPTEGGRGRETQRPLVAEDRLWCRKFALALSPTSELRGHFTQNTVVSWTRIQCKWHF